MRISAAWSSILSVAMCAAGAPWACAESEPAGSPIGSGAGGADAATDGASGTGGTSGAGGAAATGGAAGTGGGAGAEVGGAAGASGTAGASGAAGDAGTGGTAGTAGSAGAGGSAGSAGSSGAGGTGGTAVVCTQTTEISVEDVVFVDGDGYSFVAYAGTPNPALGDSAVTDYVAIQFYTDGTGKFDLGGAPNDNYATCEQCVYMREDWDGASSFAREYFQVSGALEIEPTTPPLSGTSLMAAMWDVTLADVTIDWSDTYESTFVPSGLCLHITSASVKLGCGNGSIDSGESCDGTDLGSKQCSDLGYADGTLLCTAGCTFDTSGCSGWVCNAADLGTFDGTTLTETGDTCASVNAYDAGANGTSCTGYASAGNERVFQVVLPAGAEVQVSLSSSFDGSLWVTESCDDTTGAECVVGSDEFSGDELVTISNTSADAVPYFVIADGFDETECGDFTLLIRAVPTIPGSRTCDPDFFAASDGCDCACGGWDPDCDDPQASVYGCDTGEICAPPDGVCKLP